MTRSVNTDGSTTTDTEYTKIRKTKGTPTGPVRSDCHVMCGGKQMALISCHSTQIPYLVRRF